ncbi:TerD family protein [Nocardia xishanensis]
MRFRKLLRRCGVTIDLTRPAAHVTASALLVSCYTGRGFDRIDNAFCRLVDGTADVALSRYDLAGAGAVTGFLMGVLHRGEPVRSYRRIEQGLRSAIRSRQYPRSHLTCRDPTSDPDAVRSRAPAVRTDTLLSAPVTNRER